MHKEPKSGRRGRFLLRVELGSGLLVLIMPDKKMLLLAGKSAFEF
jgi:hypothetical protein